MFQAGPFYRYLQIFGVLFTGALESHLAEDAHFTDMGIPKEPTSDEKRAMLRRISARHGCSIGPSYRHGPSWTHFSDGTLQIIEPPHVIELRVRTGQVWNETAM